MAQAPDYKILESSSRYDLRKEVITWIKLDYVPLGGVSSYEDKTGFYSQPVFIQAMYLAGNKAKPS
jgi:hypothetical protein